MTRGSSSRPNALSNSVRQSVSSARRVSSERRAGSLNQAVPLISITTWARRAPSVIPQSQPRASTPVRVPAKLALISQPTTRHYETPRTCSFRATRCKELLVTISVWSADRSGYLAFTVEQSSSPKVPWSVLAWLGGGEKVGEQLGDALSLVVMDPVRGVGQALDAVEVGHVVVLGLG
jgi:hypothetical protein